MLRGTSNKPEYFMGMSTLTNCLLLLPEVSITVPFTSMKKGIWYIRVTIMNMEDNNTETLMILFIVLFFIYQFVCFCLINSNLKYILV